LEETLTSIQKDKILELRRSGTSYTVIAEKLNLPINSVKSYCRRNKLKAVDVTGNGDKCKNCAKDIIPVKGQKKRIFCSAACRVQWWNSHPEQVKQKAVYEFTCPQCGKGFTAYGNAKRKYCSHECYIETRFGGADDE
jgi:endogenous inhibitor of DNA gyrase (YacG/DUF329 family)